MNKKIIDSISTYKNTRVIERYMIDNNVDDLEFSNELFEETKKFLVACSITKTPCSPSKKIDPMWHTFILFTKDYMSFCEDYLGRYIHHNPEKDNKKNALAYKTTLSTLSEELGGLNKKFWGFGTENEYDQCGGFPAECDNGCCHNPCGEPTESLSHPNSF